MSEDRVFTAVRAVLTMRGWVRLRNVLWIERWRDPVTQRVHGLADAIMTDNTRLDAEELEARTARGQK